MPFTSYGSIADVVRAHPTRCRIAPFIRPVPTALSDHFRNELTFTFAEVPFRGSESAACETLIYLLLREVWNPYFEALTLWSHEPIAFDADLCGISDYFVARRSPAGPFAPGAPYLLVVEAKRDDFLRNWAQCLAAMLAAQRLNGAPDGPLFGIATNGRSWEFGRLDADAFTQDPRPFSIQDADDLAAAVHFVMLECRDQAAREPVTA